MARKKKMTYETEKDSFPMNLRALMWEKNITQTELAREVGCTRQTISLYTTGQSVPDINTLSRMAETLGVSTDKLLGKAECGIPENEEIRKITGLDEASIEALKKLFKTKDESHKANQKLTALNHVIKNIYIDDFMNNLWKYLFLEFELSNGDMEKKIIYSAGCHNDMRNEEMSFYFDKISMSKIFLINIEEDLFKMKSQLTATNQKGS